GCHTDAYEQAKWLGDDLAVKGDAHYGYDFGKAGPAAAFLVKHVGGAGLPLRQRGLTGVRFPGDGRRALAAVAENPYLATDQLAAKLGLGEQVRASLRQSYERWDGKGAYGLRGDQIAMSSRLINLADGWRCSGVPVASMLRLPSPASAAARSLIRTWSTCS